jgi:23S rRNA (cytidine1920-2'-O)/16S rRNA (cytidine1409-2'-O)-methyltransferase
VPYVVDVVTIDVSFISLRHIFPSLRAFTTADADIVPLVKPQFEAGREDVGKHGLVTDSAVHEAVLARVTADASTSGLDRVGMTPSPITGATGNQEFFLHLKPRPQ